jgi:DNA-binding NtrC family response regulator
LKPQTSVITESQQHSLRQVIDELIRARVPLKAAVEQFKHLYVNQAVRLSRGNKSRAARLVGSHRNWVTRYADHTRTNRVLLEHISPSCTMA